MTQPAVTPVGRAGPVDRAGALQLLERFLVDAWSSFDRPRPAHPVLPGDLEERLLTALPEAPGDPTAAVSDAAHVLDASHSPARPLFLAYVGSSGLEMGVVGATLAAAYDANMAVNAGAVEQLERQAVAWVAALVGYPAQDGIFTSGGMVSNLTAIVAARERTVPGARGGGVREPLALYCSAEAHHSVVRAAEVAGLGGAFVRKIAIDTDRRMQPQGLVEALARDRAANVKPVAVIATAGTTLTGAVDPLEAIADVAGSEGVWLHVDGAYGLPAAAAPSTAALFRGLDRADSVTVDAHKWLGMPKSSSLLLLREREVLAPAFHHREGYMMHRGEAANAVDSTLEYSRPARSVALWLALRVHGAEAFRRWIEHTLALARHFAEAVRAAPCLELLHEPQLSTVCFRHVASDESADLDAHNTRLAQAINDDGRVHLASAIIDEQVCLRVCFVNFRTQMTDVDRLLDVIDTVARRPLG